jgi:acetyl/propionyl-CoA carboxylase alpha subunit/acetyl-CoA carboxylase carboxyltransferase component
VAIKRLAIVNRGEAAIRVLAAVAELNQAGRPKITTIALYTEPDANAWFVRRADEAVCLGAAGYTDPSGHHQATYLDEERVINAMVKAHADAAWVGWGLLSERASFAEACAAAGITFIGPDGATIRLVGDKMAAKRLAERAGVPVIPWSGGPVADAASAVGWAARLGYPVMLKAAAGGGGRGIRMVTEAAGMATALADARAEGELGFGDPTVFCEKLVPLARHIEVQILADAWGTTWAVGCRDCSVQRHNQKVIEESAAEGADERALRAAAIRIARAASYRSAGTVEFLSDPDTGQFWFLEVNPRLQVEHPVTEAASGVDLVKLQLRIADGERLADKPPVPRGHAVEARLCAEDPEQGFAPAPGRVAVWRPPAGPGIRVDSGIAEGDRIPAEFDSMIAKVVAWGHDRQEALDRLRQALSGTVVLIEGGATNRAFLLGLLRQPELTAGPVDNRWLDRLVAAAGHLPHRDPLAVAVAAVESYDSGHAADVAAFHESALRGRAELPRRAGHQVSLHYRGDRYRVSVFRTGPDTYLVDGGDGIAELKVTDRDGPHRRVACGERAHRVTTSSAGVSFTVDIDDAASHRVYLDNDDMVHARFPAFVSAVMITEGDEVAAGDPLVLLESMKMETTITADLHGTVTGLRVSAGMQVAPGDPMFMIRGTSAPGGADSVLTGLPGARKANDVYAGLSSYLLGFDPAADAVEQHLAAQSGLGAAGPADKPGLFAAECEFLAQFADVSALCWLHPENAGQLATGTRRLTPEQADLADDLREPLRAVLARYVLTRERNGAGAYEAAFWMSRSFARVGELAPAVTVILRRWLRYRDEFGHSSGLQDLVDRLAVTTRSRCPAVSDLARDVRFRLFDEPASRRLTAHVYANANRHLDDLAADPSRADRDKLIRQLVECPELVRGLLLRRWRTADVPLRKVILDVYVRRYYERRALRHTGVADLGGQLAGTADYVEGGTPCHLLVTYVPFGTLPASLEAVAAHVAETVEEARVTVDVITWRLGPIPDIEALAGEIGSALAACPFGQQVRRVNVTVTSDAYGGPEHYRTHHLSFTRAHSALTEERLYRNLHPMVAERIELGQLASFSLERLRSAEDIYLFRGIAHDNPGDVRLFAFAEVRDITVVRDKAGRIVSVAYLELMGLQALAAIRQEMTRISDGSRPELNQIVLHVRPTFDLPRRDWPGIIHRLLPLAVGARLEEIRLRVRVPDSDHHREVNVQITGLDSGSMQISELPPGGDPVPSITPLQRRVLRAHRYGAPHPHEIITMIASPAGMHSEFPAGAFTEYDLGPDGGLEPVDRPFGQHTASVITGLITSYTEAVPEGMRRMAIFGDPTTRLGSLAEEECRRVTAAIDMAERLRLPVEWFTVSSGALIAMDSGTENLDWVASSLRRIVRFTQAGGELNIIVTGINVGAQSYWNAESSMLMHTRGILIMTSPSAMVLTGKRALDVSGGVSAEDNAGIGGLDRIMGPNGQAQYSASTLAAACAILLRHYELTYVVPGEGAPRRRATADPFDRDVRLAPHPAMADTEFTTVGDIFSAEHNPDRKKPFDIRTVLRAVADADCEPLERWDHWHEAENAVVWDTSFGGIPVCLLGVESRSLPRQGYIPSDGPPVWTPGTLFPQSSRKIARAINAASGNRPVVILANLSGFDGSPESMRRRQLEYGAEIGRAVTNFDGPIVFVVISRYHGGAFVVFSKRLNDRMEVAAVEGSHASVIGGVPAAAVVFAREVTARTERNPQVTALREQLATRGADRVDALLNEARESVGAAKHAEIAAEFDRIHTVKRALAVGSIDRIISARELRPYVISALERGLGPAATGG